MSSQRRMEASRANGARSRGPVTPEGKERSAKNAIRHGLMAQTVVLQDEDPEAFETTVDALIERFQPADEFELSLIEDMAAAQWRQHRIGAIETRLLDNAAAGFSDELPIDRLVAAFESLASGPAIALVHRYETRQNRMFHRALKTLIELRKQNLPNEPNPIPEHPEAPAAASQTDPDPEPQLLPQLVPPPTPPVPTPIAPDPLTAEAARTFELLMHSDFRPLKTK